MYIPSPSAVRSVPPTVQPTAKTPEKASTNSPTPVTAAYPHETQVDQARRGSLTITTVPTLAAAALVGLSSLPVAGAQGVNEQMAVLKEGIATVLNATAANAAQGATNAAQIETLTNLTTVLTRLFAENVEDNALTRRVVEDRLARVENAATRSENAETRIELIACFALAVAAVIFIPYVIRLINSAISKFSQSTPTPPAPLNLGPAARTSDLERGSNHSSEIGLANQPFGSEIVGIDLDASIHSSHDLNLDEEKARNSGSNHSVSSLSSHTSGSGEEKA